MKRSHREAHRRIWPVLVAVVAIGFGLALAWRPAVPVSPASSASTIGRVP